MVVGHVMDMAAARAEGTSTFSIIMRGNRLVITLPLQVRLAFWLTNAPYWLLASRIIVDPPRRGSHFVHAVFAVLTAAASTAFHGAVLFGRPVTQSSWVGARSDLPLCLPRPELCPVCPAGPTAAGTGSYCSHFLWLVDYYSAWRRCTTWVESPVILAFGRRSSQTPRLAPSICWCARRMALV